MASIPVKKLQSTIFVRLLEDHERLRALLATLDQCLEEICHRQSSNMLQTAHDTALELTQEMNTHAACEEQAVFHLLSKHHPLLALEIEHEEILVQRAALVSGILNYSFPEDCNDKLYKQTRDFIDVMERHMRREERSIFPLAEQTLSVEEKRTALAKFEEIRARARVLPTKESTFSPKNYTLFQFPLTGPFKNHIHSETLIEGKGLQIKLLELSAGRALSPHWSPKHAAILLYSGEAQWIGADSSLMLSAGDGVLMDPGLSHALEAKTDCRFLLVLTAPFGA